MNKIIIYAKKERPKNRIVLQPILCDICGTVLCKNNETLPSFRVSTYCSNEIYEHYCDVHTKDIDTFVKKLKEDYKNGKRL
jgi:hypothetical protein